MKTELAFAALAAQMAQADTPPAHEKRMVPVEARGDSLVVRDAARNENLFDIPNGGLLLPDFAKEAGLVANTVADDGARRLNSPAALWRRAWRPWFSRSAPV